MFMLCSCQGRCGGANLSAASVGACSAWVNSVHPGLIETPIWGTISSTTSAMNTGANRIDLDAVSAIATPLGVKGYPKDIALGVLYLASDESRYVTGTELVIDGGMHAR